MSKGALQKLNKKQRAHRRNFDCLFLPLCKKSIKIPRSRLLMFGAGGVTLDAVGKN
jgi:hypothetical protein